MEWFRAPNTADHRGSGERLSRDGRASDDFRSSGDFRPGKFPDLQDFASWEGAGSYNLLYRPGSFVEPQPGDIIHIIDSEHNDQSRRLHARVMMIVRLAPPTSMSCVPLCQHEDRHVSKSHWQVTTERANDGCDEADGVMDRLYIELKHGALQPGILVNLNERWNVEYHEPRIVVLGHVQTSVWNRVIDRIRALEDEALRAVKLPQIAPVEMAKQAMLPIPSTQPYAEEHEDRQAVRTNGTSRRRPTGQRRSHSPKQVYSGNAKPRQKPRRSSSPQCCIM